jgi:excisionase family DNA binding protein
MTDPHPAQLPARLLTITDVAERLQVSTKTLRRWIERGDLAAHRLGHQWRIAERDLVVFLKLRRVG